MALLLVNALSGDWNLRIDNSQARTQQFDWFQLERGASLNDWVVAGRLYGSIWACVLLAHNICMLFCLSCLQMDLLWFIMIYLFSALQQEQTSRCHDVCSKRFRVMNNPWCEVWRSRTGFDTGLFPKGFVGVIGGRRILFSWQVYEQKQDRHQAQKKIRQLLANGTSTWDCWWVWDGDGVGVHQLASLATIENHLSDSYCNHDEIHDWSQMFSITVLKKKGTVSAWGSLSPYFARFKSFLKARKTGKITRPKETMSKVMMAPRCFEFTVEVEPPQIKKSDQHVSLISSSEFFI